MQGDALAGVEGISPMNEPGTIPAKWEKMFCPWRTVSGSEWWEISNEPHRLVKQGETCNSATGWSYDELPVKNPSGHLSAILPLACNLLEFRS